MIIDLFRLVFYSFICLFLFAILYVYFNQNKMLYMPEIEGQCSRNSNENPRGYRNPLEEGMQYEDIFITTNDGIKLHGWFIKQEETTKSPTIIYFHENAGNIGTRIPFLKRIYNQLKVNIILVAYRGFSQSQGQPNEEGLMIDGEAVLNFVFNELKNEIDDTKIFVFGRSLGGAVSVHTLFKHKEFKVKALILENTFTSIADIVDHLFSFISFAKRFLQKNFWPTEKRIGTIECPILFISSEKDELIPIKMMEKLYDLAEKARFKRKTVIKQATHNDAWQVGGSNYWNKFKEFIKECLSEDETLLNEKTSLLE